jgi:hypothetical protein
LVPIKMSHGGVQDRFSLIVHPPEVGLHANQELEDNLGGAKVR